jgi:hypothetical protein
VVCLHRYGVYGIALRSEIPLSLPEMRGGALGEITLRRGTSQFFTRALKGATLTGSSDWCQYADLEDGSSFMRWNSLGEFLVPAGGREIVALAEAGASMESFQVYLLGQALSFALVKQGLEPLHGTAVVAGHGAIVLLGDSGFGKSTLAASLMQAGYPLLTDDLLVARQNGRGVEAYPGPPRIKLFPKPARRFLGSAGGAAMNPTTHKQIIPIEGARRCATPVRLSAIYVLAAPSEMRRQRRVVIETLTAREAFLALIRHTFNTVIDDRGRLARQLEQTARLVESVPVRKLCYPRSLSRLGEVRDAILADSQKTYERTA